MDEQSGGNAKRLFILILIVAVIAGAWYFLRQPGPAQAIDETLDVFVPDAEEFNRRTTAVDQARQVTEQINSRPQAGRKDRNDRSTDK